MEDSPCHLQRLRCSVKNYDWGLPGRVSEVARLHALNSNTPFHAEDPYAELWIGTHDSGPSFLASNGVSLKSWISDNPDVLGDQVLRKWGSDLPFLFKVLSVGKALSIQAHPDKELARILHKLHPDLYKDGNHKPEMALAITNFEALCGFITLKELKGVLHSTPEIVELVGATNTDLVLQTNDEDGEEKVKPVLKAVFTDLMSASKERVTDAVNRLKSRLLQENEVRQLTDKEQLVLRLERQYPSDVGVIAAFFLNLVKLNPGEALFLGANEPHAYLSGECVECMATSDNVVRAGLTPKHRDVQTLCSMLTYKQGSPEILHGVSLNQYVNKYTPPFEEFEIDRCILPQGERVVFPAVPGPSIFLVTVGEGNMNTGSPKGHVVTQGDVLFAAANTEISVTSASELHLYRTGVNSKVFQAS
ncbi:mannose-6-phosphate isomerase 1-like [Vigna unguiculata]|uniref:Mannose-6-phosphate isomerase n=1 Tax=Vigna unguiculata TaxID=3917 RepID=A0A4D6NIY1_VIGUN|nr:mannose-6-phosphate isomerase 1-like [Vigna unguiculata]QCE12941.1 mannose-6-phosphate isomerase [Vigna unguiculata]